MASKHHHHEETAIDKMHSHLTDAGSKVAANKKGIIIVLAIVFVVAAFTMSYLFIYRNPHVTKAFEEYNAVQTTATSDSIAAQQYKAVADKYSGDTAGKLAALSAAEILYTQGNYGEALEYLQKFSSDDDILEANALVLTGDCYVNLEQYDEALSTYQQAIRKANGNSQIVPRVLLKEANIYDAQQNYAKALDCYTEIMNNYPEFQLGNGMEIEAYVARENARLGKE